MLNFNKAEESVTRATVPYKKKSAFVYEVKLSNAEPVLRQCLDFVKQDAAGCESYFLVFDAHHSHGKTVGIMALRNILNDYQDILFSAKLVKFAILVKSFILQRGVISLFDDLFDAAKMNRTKYSYFSEKKARDEMMQWLLN